MLSIICPTRNRATLWRSGWFLSALGAQSQLPDELVIAIDHTEDDTLDAIRGTLDLMRFPVETRILEVDAPRPGTNPASGLPDNCLFHAARGDLLLHLDDDCKIQADTCATLSALLQFDPGALIWIEMHFTDFQLAKLADYPLTDGRVELAKRFHWQYCPGGIYLIPTGAQCRWGAAWATSFRNIWKLGGHALDFCQYHQTDSRLGYRAHQYGLRQYVTGNESLHCYHLGPSWHMAHKGDRAAINQSRGPRSSQAVANGGPDFWRSDFWQTAYHEVLHHRLTPGRDPVQ